MSSTPLNQSVYSATEFEFVSQIIDSIAIPMFILNKDHVITHWNKAMEVTSNLKAEDMVGSQNQWCPFYPAARPTMADLVLNGMKQEDLDTYYKNKYRPSHVLENAFEAEDYFEHMGAGEWLSFTASPILNEQGAVIGAVETLVVISDRKKAEFELIQREQAYREMSIIDDLTQLYNTRYFYEQFSAELDRCKRYQQGLAVCMFDIDHFKRVNDTYGHLFGNEVLETFGKLIRSSVRSIDTAYRYGGEEFMILLPSVSTDSAFIVADRIRTSLSKIAFQPEDDRVVSITTSGGITCYQHGDDVKTMLERVDKALYLAKDSGRNQIALL